MLRSLTGDIMIIDTPALIRFKDGNTMACNLETQSRHYIIVSGLIHIPNPDIILHFMDKGECISLPGTIHEKERCFTLIIIKSEWDDMARKAIIN